MTRKSISKAQLEQDLNTTGMSAKYGTDDISLDEEDFIEIEAIYDSDQDKEYVPSIHSSDEDSNFEGFEDISIDAGPSDIEVAEPPRKRARGRATSTPRKNVHLAPDVDCPAIFDSQIPSTSQIPSSSQISSTSSSAVDLSDKMYYFNTPSLTSKSGYKWKCRPSQTGVRIPARNIINFIPGPTPPAQDADTEEKSFRLLFDDQIVNELVKWTNKRIALVSEKYVRKTATVSSTEPGEISALLGMMIFSGCQRDNHLSTKEIFCTKTGHQLYRATMSEERFNFLSFCMRFDNPDTRLRRKQTDPFAAIRNIWDMFIGNCEQMYTPSEHITIDEQLLAFRGRCSFRMYIPSKPAKYGLKLVFANDNKSKYLLRGIPYVGKKGTNTEDAAFGLGYYFTTELLKPYYNSNRNVTTDNWFTSIKLANDLLNCGITLVGTIRANKKEIPVEIKSLSDRAFGSSAFLYTEDLTLVSYVPSTTKTKKKNVLLLSSMHSKPTLTQSGKPEIINFYNKTKGGVDTFDQMCSTYSCSRRTRRWTLCIFYGLLNACCINAFIIHSDNMKRSNKKPMMRRMFMRQLALQLIAPWATSRINIKSLSKPLKDIISTTFDLETTRHPASVVEPSTSNAAKRCNFCPRSKDRKTKRNCLLCHKALCNEHTVPVCSLCYNDE